ncbi:MAG: thiol-disulfide oxidoreductase DCC family protein [Lentisphaerae bacterium]|nr:thiol-disulfide oxidoreductase DCC family protein [Lentisphaerota bacterium]
MIVLFDGVCNLCNRSVDFIIRHDSHHAIRLASQQSAAGRRLLAEAGMADAAGTSIVVLDGARIYTRSKAALVIARAMGAPWSLFYALILIPPPMRDSLYDWIARHRYRWFGQRDTCRLPTPEERTRFVE